MQRSELDTRRSYAICAWVRCAFPLTSPRTTDDVVGASQDRCTRTRGRPARYGLLSTSPPIGASLVRTPWHGSATAGAVRKTRSLQRRCDPDQTDVWRPSPERARVRVT